MDTLAKTFETENCDFKKAFDPSQKKGSIQTITIIYLI